MSTATTTVTRNIKRLLVANRGEIAIRIFRAATELGIRTIGIHSEEDRLSLHRYKADEAYLIGKGKNPVQAYLDIEGIIKLALSKEIDAIHPGYGFLSENAEFAQACKDAGIIFVGPSPQVIEMMGDKQRARHLAIESGVPVVPGSDGLVEDVDAAFEVCRRIGFPVMIKAAFGGGGRGMRRVENESLLKEAFIAATNEAKNAFGRHEVFIERLVSEGRHVEVQILADSHGNMVHLFERDCTIQRRHQKIIEIAPAIFTSEDLNNKMHNWALQLASKVGYVNAGTLEFLYEKSGNAYFMEMNPRIQVEHTVTEEITGRDLVKAQILIADGFRLSEHPINIPTQAAIFKRGVAMQCRITTEDPSKNFLPDTGKILVFRTSGGPGTRLDISTAGEGHRISPSYDSMLLKITASTLTFPEVVAKMDRTLREFRIRGVKTNIPFLLNLIHNQDFQNGNTTTTFIDAHPELLQYAARQDRATKILGYLAETTVNGAPYVKAKKGDRVFLNAPVPNIDYDKLPEKGTKQILDESGPDGVIRWIKEQKKLLITDTTLRDAHQSLLATRVRTFDMMSIAPAIAQQMPELFSLEMWGGATFDVAYRFLRESSFKRLETLRTAIPNILFQMLLRGSNAVGYTAYPDNVVRLFIRESAKAGMDIFRIFDSLNWVENMKVAIEESLKTDKLVEGSICYTGDITDPKRTKYTLDYYIKMAKELESLGVHILAIKDMAGLCKPYAAEMLVKALKSEINIPVHFHTHDTSGNGIAAYLKAAEAGVDIVDCAISSMSGTTSQPNLQALTAALSTHPRDTQLKDQALQDHSAYWEVVRQYYFPFEAGLIASAPDVYVNEIPGGQYSNLKQQVESMGLAHRWEEVKKMYTEVNFAFGDLVKVTPSSKAVGDMAIALISKNYPVTALDDEKSDLSFPDSVVSLFSGQMGQPLGGFPKKLQDRILGGKKPETERPGIHLPPADIEAVRASIKEKHHILVDDAELSAALLYPKVYDEFLEFKEKYGRVSVMDTPSFLFGLRVGEETTVEIEAGKSLIITLVAIGELEKGGFRTVYFDLNGRAREVRVHDSSIPEDRTLRKKADPKNPHHVSAPMPGKLTKVAVKVDQEVRHGDLVAVTEAMKMENAIMAKVDGHVGEILIQAGENVEAGDLILVIKQ